MQHRTSACSRDVTRADPGDLGVPFFCTNSGPSKYWNVFYSGFGRNVKGVWCS